MISLFHPERPEKGSRLEARRLILRAGALVVLYGLSATALMRIVPGPPTPGRYLTLGSLAALIVLGVLAALVFARRCGKRR